MASALSLRAARILDDQDLLAALRHDAITAPCVIDGPISGETFTAYVEQLLVPTLTRGDIVIMDNLGAHERPAVRTAIEVRGDAILRHSIVRRQALSCVIA